MNNSDKVKLTSQGRRAVKTLAGTPHTIEAKIISYLRSDRTATVEELGANLKIPEGNLKSTLEKLQKSGHVERKFDIDTSPVVVKGKSTDTVLRGDTSTSSTDKVIGSGVDTLASGASKVIGSGADKVIGKGASKVVGANIFLV